ncbi:hypothetical protein GCM10008921_25760 [Metaclostridioides mangenotii]
MHPVGLSINKIPVIEDRSENCLAGKLKKQDPFKQFLFVLSLQSISITFLIIYNMKILIDSVEFNLLFCVSY